VAEVETLILANHAEAINGLLYMSGGGWTDHWRPPVPTGGLPISHLGVAVTVIVPWNEIDMAHHVYVAIEDDDGQTMLQMVSGVQIGRPPDLPPGSDQRAVLAMLMNLVFPHPGGYRLLGRLGNQTKTVQFRVHDLPAPPQLQQAPGAAA
jgi:hypothetical protein